MGFVFEDASFAGHIHAKFFHANALEAKDSSFASIQTARPPTIT
jgi:hypothetical protein